MKMKKTAVMIILLALLLPLCFAVSAGAADPDYYTPNMTLIEERCALLKAEMDKHTDPYIKEPIIPYYNAIFGLQGDARVNTEDLSAEIEMYYLKGCIAGQCALVFVTYSEGLGETELESARTKYQDTLNSISGNSDYSDLEAKKDIYPLNLMKEIYLQKIDMLYDSTDSETVAVLAFSYKMEINEISAFDESEFDRIYNEAKTAIEIQRVREDAEASFSSLYNTVYGDGAYVRNSNTDSIIISFLYDIKKSDTVAEFNANIKAGAEKILASLFEGKDGEYCKALLASISGSLTETVTAADALGKIAEGWSAFEGISLGIEKAYAKDTLAEYISVSSASEIEGMSTLVAEYNAEGGIFDTCADSESVATELGKAKLRVDWLIYIRRAESKIKGIYGTHNATSDINKLGELYSPYDSAIKSKATMGAAQDALTEAKVAADKIVSDVSALLEEERKNAQSRIDSALQSCLYDMKHEIKYLGNADEFIASMLEKHSGRTEELKAAQSLSELDDIVSAARGELGALYAEAEKANLAAAIEANTKKIRDKESSALSEIAKLGYLDDSGIYTSPIETRADEDAGMLALMSDIAEIESLAAEYEEYADGVLDTAKAENAENERIYLAREAAKDKLEASRDAALGKLGELKYLSDEESEAAKAEISDAYSLALGAIEAEESVDGINSKLTEGENAIDAVVSEASLLNTENARGAIKNELKEKFDSYAEEDYSEDNYKAITDAYNNAVAALDAGKSIGDFLAARDTAFRLMSSVVSEFDAAKLAAKKELTDAYNKFSESSDRYSEENLAKLTEIYQHTLAEIDSFDKNKGAEALTKTVGERIKLMRDVRVDWVGSGNIGASSGSSADYPAGHDPSADRLWGVVSGSEGLYFDISLSITEKDIQKSHKTSLKEALEKSLISYVGDNPLTNEDIAKILGDSDIKAVYDIKLIREGEIWSDFAGRYTVRILLPKSMRDINGLRAVYISEDGSAEYYDAKRDGAFLVFETTHFSEFIIVGEKTVNLLPIIIVLGVLAVAEAACAAVLTYISRKGKRETLAAFAPAPILSVIAPKGAVAWIIILAAADIALGVYIAACVVRMLKARAPEEAAEEPEPTQADFGEELPEEIPAPVLTIEPMESVSAEEADALVPDSSVEEIIVKENSPEIVRGKKAFVNVDTISEHFEAGETVTLGALKEKKLVPSNVCYLKVLARGVIDKPLTVKAQSFSANAVKMIALTGGSAVIEGNGDYTVS